LPVSIKTNVEEVIRTINQLPLPIKAVIIEDVQIDIARLNDAKLNGFEVKVLLRKTLTSNIINNQIDCMKISDWLR